MRHTRLLPLLLIALTALALTGCAKEEDPTNTTTNTTPANTSTAPAAK